MSKKKLYKSQNKIFAGVCGGLAEYLNMDPIIVRLIVVALAVFFAGFPVLVFYIIAAFIVPSVPLDDDENLKSANINEDSEVKIKNTSSKSDDEEFNSHFEK